MSDTDLATLSTVLVATDDVKILVAEDDKFDELILRRAFRAAKLNADVEFVEHGRALLDYLEDPSLVTLPKVIFLDLNMPVLDGWAVLRELRAMPNLAELPVIVMSTLSTNEDIAKVTAAGGSYYFTKPVTFDDLVTVIRDATSKWL